MTAAPRIAVVDYGAGNLRSVAKALERSGLLPEVTGDPSVVVRADAVVLPGAGAFADAATKLAAGGLDEAVRESIASGRPYLGLCLGMQLLFESSDEHGATPGLAILPGHAHGAHRRRVDPVDAAALRRRDFAEVRVLGGDPAQVVPHAG